MLVITCWRTLGDEILVILDSGSKTYVVDDRTLSIPCGRGPVAGSRSEDSEHALMEALSCVKTCCQQFRSNNIPVW